MNWSCLIAFLKEYAKTRNKIFYQIVAIANIDKTTKMKIGGVIYYGKTII